jgi:hypothetical protein
MGFVEPLDKYMGAESFERELTPQRRPHRSMGSEPFINERRLESPKNRFNQARVIAQSSFPTATLQIASGEGGRIKCSAV